MKLVTKPSSKLGSKGGAWLKGLIDASIKKDEDYFRFMTNLRNLAAGKHWENIKGVKKEDIKMMVNLAHAHVRSLVPTLFFQNPSADCAPTAPQHAGKEKTWNGVINNTLDKINFSSEIKKAVLDSVIYPEGIIKDVTNKPEKPQSESGSSGPTVWLSKGSPLHVRIAPIQLIVDYTVPNRDVENARFIAIRYRKPLHELKHHPVYKSNINKNVTPKKTPTTGNLVSKVSSDDQDWEQYNDNKVLADSCEEFVTIYEVWIHQLISEDGETQLYQQMCVLMEDQEEPIRELETWSNVMGEGFNQFPVTRLVLNELPDMPPLSELGAWQGMQMALNWLMSRVTQLVENDRQIYEVDVTKLVNPSKAKKQFTSGKTREWVEVNQAGAINLIQPTFVGRDNYSLINLVEKYIQQVGGIGQNRRAGAGIRTATEASLIDRGVELKTDEKTDSVSKFLHKILTKSVMIIRALVKNEAGVSWVFRIGGDVGAFNWVTFTPEELDWFPDIRIRVNSFRKMDSIQDMQKWAGLLQQAMGLFQLYGPTIRVDLIFSRMLEAAGVYDADKLVGSFDSESMLQMIEIAAILSGVDTPVLEQHNHVAHKQTLTAFKQSLIGQQILARAPEVADVLAQHEAQHDQWLMIVQEKAAKMSLASGDPFSAAGQSTNPNAQSVATQLTEGDRTIPGVPGGNGELA